MHGKPIHAPVLPLEAESRVLEVGCGTGHLALELAETNPAAKIIGLDISAVPVRSSPPPNLEFVQANILGLEPSDPRFQPESFDFVFHRLLICGMTKWQDYVKTVATLVKSGGWVEMQDYDMVYLRDGDESRLSTHWDWAHVMGKGSASVGLDLECGPHIQQYMHDSGLLNVRVHVYRVPLGEWMAETHPESRRIGKQRAETLPGVMQQILEKQLHGKVDERKIQMLKTNVVETLSAAGRCYINMFVTIGQKP